MRNRVTRIADPAMRQFIDAFFVERGACEESVSYLTQEIRWAGYYFPTNHTEGMRELERPGYKLRKEHNEYRALLRTYVQAPATRPDRTAAEAAINQAIASSNRSGRKISASEAKLIHKVLAPRSWER